MGRLKVVHVITRMDLGGAQGNTLYTARHLDPAKFDCVVAVGPGGVLDEDLLSRAPPRTVFVPGLVREIRPLRDLGAIWRLWRLFRAERPDIVHTHSSKAGILGRVAARLAGVRAVVHTYHGFGFHDLMPAWRKWLYVQAERLACRLTHRVVFVSNANVDYARRHGLIKHGRETLIRSGVKLGDFPARLADRQALLSSVGLPGKKLLVTSIGNLKPQKNPHDFLSLASRLAREFKDAGFLFVGEGPLRPELDQRVGDAPGSLSLPGWRLDVPQILAASDVFVLTSLWEGLPRTLVEAMATGLACACYETDGVKDLLRDAENGCLVPKGSLPLLIERVRGLLQDADSRRRLGENARRSVSTEFDIDLMVRRQEELYCELLRPSR
ncbi:MAG: glycosyltransferase family 4 protein [Elusimicrobia bacterium]|nr:glycosyltransferase family 4 protein [Elusimicrobiota bacterium]